MNSRNIRIALPNKMYLCKNNLPALTKAIPYRDFAAFCVQWVAIASTKKMTNEDNPCEYRKNGSGLS